MKSNWLFYFGVIINAVAILISVSNASMMQKTFKGLNGNDISYMEGMPEQSKLMLWFIPLALLAVIGISFWFKSIGKMLFANILLWIPALPVLLMIVFWGGLALLFILFGK